MPSAILGARFPGRVATRCADLNFAELERDAYDVIVSSSSLHHVTNLEHLAWQINAVLASDGWFFLNDYVGEPRFQFASAKRVFESVHDREVARTPGRSPGCCWMDASDLSPFCGVRSYEVLSVLRAYLQEVEVRTAAPLTVALMRSKPADGALVQPPASPGGWRMRPCAGRWHVRPTATGARARVEAAARRASWSATCRRTPA